ncbi:3'-5' exonuclease [Mangrovitalea sediminis]|uniref:3'-5' exonuclease n=1 Tax=Mangrovitalea sediminis TaxID=1982043 RepID=UPI000BE55237|nr:hypothetical protein [Mangrovitalea sediminis]
MMQQQSPVFIDFEASSLDLVASYPIEVGLCLADGTTHSWLIRPHVLWLDWSESAEKIHRIPRERLIEEGVEASDVATALNQLIPGVAYCDAWTFDSFWLHRLFRAARVTPSFQLESVSMILNASEVALWPDVRRQVIERLDVSVHRAANDAYILLETWKDVVAGRRRSASPS